MKTIKKELASHVQMHFNWRHTVRVGSCEVGGSSTL